MSKKICQTCHKELEELPITDTKNYTTFRCTNENCSFFLQETKRHDWLNEHGQIVKSDN